MYDKYQDQIKLISKELNENTDKLDKGISIVIPVYDGFNYINTCLESILNQEISTANYEVIIVFNGKFLDDLNYIYNQINKYNTIDITLLINDEPSAGAARNLGVRYANYTHVTFIDIDDYISPNFIQSGFDFLDPQTILYTQIHNISDGYIDTTNSLNYEIINASNKKSIALMDLNKISTITACKIIPKKFLLTQEFRSSLKSGEDTVYFCELFANNRPKLQIVPIEENAIYYRVIRMNSISRKAENFDFLILQRVEILEILDELYDLVKNKQVQRLIRSKYLAQIVFMNNYIKNNLDEHGKIIDLVSNMNLQHFDYSVLNRNLAKKLVISYCFPPFSDTSATIVSKRILEENQIVDVISNNMSKIRKKEYSLKKIIRHLVGENKTSNNQASFSNMFYLNKFVDDAFNLFSKNLERYEEIYSRAMFPISHFPPLFMKVLKPEVRWVAEFSDPLLMDIHSNKRFADIENVNLVKYLTGEILGPFKKYVDKNLFNLMEIIPFALADELVFTNEHQLETMIERFNSEEKAILRKKSVIHNHPTLDREYYNLKISTIKFDESVINIGYFGNFYENRSYHHFIKLIDYLNHKFEYQFKLHLFTNIDVISEEEQTVLENLNINLYPYLSFLEFLNTTQNLDFLLISDALTHGIKDKNPYLPSKLSDYLGSNTPIIGFVENGSIMSNDKNGIIKINMDNFKHDEFNIKDNTLTEIKEKIDKGNDRRYLVYGPDSTDLYRDNVELSVSPDLSINNLRLKEWIIKPIKLPIKMKNTYTLYYKNIGEEIERISIQSFYSVKNVIKVNIDFNGEFNNDICITKFRNIKEVSVNPNEYIKIKLKYKKYYNQKSFLEAGRLKLTNL